MIGKRLKEVRELKGFTQEYLALKINKSVRTVSSYENDLTNPPIDVLAEICSVLKISSDYLLGISDIMSEDMKGLDVDEIGLIEYIKQYFINKK